LADFILSFPHLFTNKNVLELASGTGVTSIVAGLYATRVIATGISSSPLNYGNNSSSSLFPDVDRGDILGVIRRNFRLNNHVFVGHTPLVAELDFFKEDWKLTLDPELDNVDVILAADVVYNRAITDGFFQTLNFFLRKKKFCKSFAIFIAVERRTQVDRDGQRVSPNFDHFNESLVEMCHAASVTLAKLECDFHQFFKSYERVQDLHLFKISPMEQQ
jgi:predicted nicotinamide N-methyase